MIIRFSMQDWVGCQVVRMDSPEENTGFCFFTEVKPYWAELTILCSLCCTLGVRSALWSKLAPPTSAIICEPSLGQSQLDLMVFLQLLRPVFLPLQKRLPVNYTWLGCCALRLYMSVCGSRRRLSHAFGQSCQATLNLKSHCGEWSMK